MKLHIIKKISWKKTFLVLLDESYNEVKRELLTKEKTFLDIDLSNEKFIYFTNNKTKSEVVVLSNNLSEICFSYCQKTKQYKCDLSIYRKKRYGKVETFNLKDEKNLFYREDHSKLINVYLPTYYKKSKQYKVLLMFDSQNIFHLNKVGKYTTKNDPYGSWQVETSIEHLRKEYIVVGIENADKYRELELTFNMENMQCSSLLKKWIIENENATLYLENLNDFINETLMPFIVKKYNVSLENMGICGASCGGLASLYVGLANIEKYDFIFTFSSALGILDNNLLNEFLSVFNLRSIESYPLIFSYCGNNDPLEKLLFKGDILLKNALISQGYPDSKIYEYYEESALHNEDSWRYAFNFGLTLIK